MKIFLMMILMHIIDDFVLQPICLAKMKQKEWWKRECKKSGLNLSRYKDDYVTALIIHATSWSIMMMLPIVIFWNIPEYILAIVLLVNIAIHASVDHLKCNRYSLNLAEDQILHLTQILCTYIVLYSAKV